MPGDNDVDDNDCSDGLCRQVRSNNVTVNGGTTEVVGVGKETKVQTRNGKGNGKRKAKDVANEWQAALGPYPVVSPGTRWAHSSYVTVFTIFDHNRFSREASFVHAISSAGVAHAVTRSCSSGLKNKIF